MVDIVTNLQVGTVVVVTEEVATPVVVQSPTELQVTHPAANEVSITREAYDVVLTTGGIQGPAGEDGDKHYRHVQTAPAQVWVIDHDLDKFPAVSVVDSAGEQVEGNVTYTSQQQVVVSFAGAFSGEAFLN